jgi:hypothetical protein
VARWSLRSLSLRFEASVQKDEGEIPQVRLLIPSCKEGVVSRSSMYLHTYVYIYVPVCEEG